MNDQCQRLGLDPRRIQLHETRIRNHLASGEDIYISIRDTCRIENKGIIPPEIWQNFLAHNIEGMASFTPAAGASSRYLEPLTDFLDALEKKDLTRILTLRTTLIKKGALTWNLPPAIKKALNQDMSIAEEDFLLIAHEAALPKALLPCNQTGETFFQAKMRENMALDFLKGHAFVASPRFRGEFKDHSEAFSSPAPVAILEQGLEQSTIRFTQDVNPLIESDGSFSVVPAGHGTLASFLPKLSQLFPGVHSALIRNIDNVMGTDPEVLNWAHRFCAFQSRLVDEIRNIRIALKNGEINNAEGRAQNILQGFGHHASQDSYSYHCLWQLLEKVFHSQKSLLRKTLGPNIPELDLLKKAYGRPVNVLGQVPNVGNDVGGVPVYSQFDGIPYKICLEMPHISVEDREKFLNDHRVMTHFNPVFAAVEIDFAENYYEQAEFSSWLLAKKTYKGQTVFYHESVLYELLGSSILTNLVFVEIPRILFAPHKRIDQL